MIDCEDVALVAEACLIFSGEHAGKTYRMGYDAKTFYDIADMLFTVLGKPFHLRAAATVRVPAQRARRRR